MYAEQRLFRRQTRRQRVQHMNMKYKTAQQRTDTSRARLVSHIEHNDLHITLVTRISSIVREMRDLSGY